MMLGRAGRDWETLEMHQSAGPSNLPLGVLADARYTQEQIRVLPGDRVFAYTDGVAECPGPDETQYGDEKLLHALNRSTGEPLANIRETLREDLTSHAGGPLVHDDVTFLLVEVLPPLPFLKRRILPGKPTALSQTARTPAWER